MQNQKGNIVLIIVGIVAVAILAGGVGYFVARKPAQKEEQKQQAQTNQQQQIQQEQQKTISETTEQKIEQPEAKGETADWKTYRNEKYGFEVMYPNNWEYTTINNRVCFGETGVDYSSDAGHIDCAITISVADATDPKRLSIDKLIEMRRQGQSNLKVENFKISGVDATRIINYGDETYFDYQNNAFVVSNATWEGVKGFEDIDEVITEMLKTFKFIK